MPKKSIEDIVHDKYDDPDVAAHVLESIKTHNTADKILSGELVLPSHADALRNHQIAQGTFATTDTERNLQQQNKSLQERLDRIEQHIASTPKQG